MEFRFWMVLGETEVQSGYGQLVTENTEVYDSLKLKSSNCILRHCSFQISTFHNLAKNWPLSIFLGLPWIQRMFNRYVSVGVKD